MGERTRGANIVPWIETLVADARYAVRTMRGTPVVTVAAVRSLAPGIGATTAIFTLIDVLMLRPLPVERPEELRSVISGRSDDAIVGSFLSNPLFEEFRARQDMFTSVAAVSTRLSEERVDGEVHRSGPGRLAANVGSEHLAASSASRRHAARSRR